MNDDLCPVCHIGSLHEDETGSGGISCPYCVRHIAEIFKRECTDDLSKKIRGCYLMDTERYSLIKGRKDRISRTDKARRRCEEEINKTDLTRGEQERLMKQLEIEEEDIKRMAEEREEKILAVILNRQNMASAKAQEEAEKQRRFQEISCEFYGC